MRWLELAAVLLAVDCASGALLGPRAASAPHRPLHATTRSAAPLLTELSGLPEEDTPAVETRRTEVLSVRRAWALMFNPRSENEGIYSRRMGNDGRDMVLVFEEAEDADRYAEMLTAQDFPEATSVEVGTEMLLEFCDEGGHVLGLVKAGKLVVPPEQNVPTFDWSAGVSEEAQQVAAQPLLPHGSPLALGSAPRLRAACLSAHRRPRARAAQGPQEMTEEELEERKRMLESLLGGSGA